MDWERVREIEERAGRATEGPWLDGAESEECVLRPIPAVDGDWVMSGNYDGEVIVSPADKAFILASREDVPWLVERLREMRQVVAGAAGTLELLANAYNEQMDRCYDDPPQDMGDEVLKVVDGLRGLCLPSPSEEKAG